MNYNNIPLYEMIIDKDGYRAIKHDAIKQDSVSHTYAWYEIPEENFTVLESKCYTKEKYEMGSASIEFDYYYYKDEDMGVYKAYSLVEPDERIKNIFISEIQMYIRTTLQIAENRFEIAARNRDRAILAKEKFYQSISEKGCDSQELEEEYEM